MLWSMLVSFTIAKLVCFIFNILAVTGDGCVTYKGPHTTICLNSLWVAAGCLEEGFSYPDSLSSGELSLLQNQLFT